MTDRDRQILGPKSKAVDDVPMVREWRNRHDYCAACGLRGPITVHHILGGRDGRSDEACNLLALCWSPCHQLAEGLDVRFHDVRGVKRLSGNVAELLAGNEPTVDDLPLMPKLTIGHCLTLKMRADPDEYDEVRLQELRGSRLPDPEPLPEFFEQMYQRRRGVPS